MTIDANLITGIEIGFGAGFVLGLLISVFASVAIYYKTKKELSDKIRRDH